MPSLKKYFGAASIPESFRASWCGGISTRQWGLRSGTWFLNLSIRAVCAVARRPFSQEPWSLVWATGGWLGERAPFAGRRSPISLPISWDSVGCATAIHRGAASNNLRCRSQEVVVASITALLYLAKEWILSYHQAQLSH